MNLPFTDVRERRPEMRRNPCNQVLWDRTAQHSIDRGTTEQEEETNRIYNDKRGIEPLRAGNTESGQNVICVAGGVNKSRAEGNFPRNLGSSAVASRSWCSCTTHGQLERTHHDDLRDVKLNCVQSQTKWIMLSQHAASGDNHAT